MVKPWMLDELAHAGPEHLDPGFVAGSTASRDIPILPTTSPCSLIMASGRPARW
jgi:hypothetical protein